MCSSWRVHGTVQAEALVWWDWFSLMKKKLFVFPFREGRDHICLRLCPLLDPLEVCVVVLRPDPSSGCRYLLLWLLGCHLLRPWLSLSLGIALGQREMARLSSSLGRSPYPMTGGSGVQRTGSLVRQPWNAALGSAELEPLLCLHLSSTLLFPLSSPASLTSCTGVVPKSTLG